MSNEKSLYERIGGVYAISGGSLQRPASKKPEDCQCKSQLKEWHTEEFKVRLPGLKFDRTLWVCAVSGGPYEYTAKNLHDAHSGLQITPEVFDEVSAELAGTLDYFKVPEREKQEVLTAFNAQKPDVTAGSISAAGR